MKALRRRFPVYSRLLYLYPAPYRQKYASQMMQTLADMLDDPSRAKAAIWTRTALDFPLSLLKQNLFYTGEIMANETPSYVKRNAYIGGALVAPFFIIIAINSLSGNRLADSQDWKNIFYTLLLVLPALGFVLNAATLIKWAAERKAKAKTGFWRNLFDVQRNWLTLGVTGLALLITLFVPFHDSVHCLSGNPIKEARNFHQSWQCVRQR